MNIQEHWTRDRKKKKKKSNGKLIWELASLRQEAHHLMGLQHPCAPTTARTSLIFHLQPCPKQHAEGAEGRVTSDLS